MSPADHDAIRIVTVCSHNRTRSVMMMAMLQAGLDDRLGTGRSVVQSLGFGPEGRPPIEAAVDAMAARGLDITEHRSRRITADRLAGADLVLTSERQHVVGVASASPELFSRTFTLPEFCDGANALGSRQGSDLADWVHPLTDGRLAADYLRADVPEVDDPTGLPRRKFAAATQRIEEMCARVVDALAERR